MEKELELKTPQLTIVEEKIKGLEHEKLALSAEEAKAEADLRKLVQEFISTVVRRLHTSVEYRQSLAAPSWGGRNKPRSPSPLLPYIQKVADSCDLPINELLKVSPDVPSSADKGDTSSVVAEEAP
ncbi:hypothetical protein Tco_0801110 [Tanacetum coccineum]|uniref:Uncharacterized protein n=1 Tax=Tanacetum coccineum TaxID=301880 RepID=A0ABQ4ZVZ6_9ASTR